jgi:hypothetical protein
MEMEPIIMILGSVSATVITGLAAANVVSLIGYATRHRKAVERFQRSILRATSLFRLGAR